MNKKKNTCSFWYIFKKLYLREKIMVVVRLVKRGKKKPSWMGFKKGTKKFVPINKKHRNYKTCGPSQRPVCRPRNYDHTKKWYGKKSLQK